MPAYFNDVFNNRSPVTGDTGHEREGVCPFSSHKELQKYAKKTKPFREKFVF